MFPECVVVGKIIVDTIHDGHSEDRQCVGGGGPQAALGARLWCENVALVAPVGADFDRIPELLSLGVDVDGLLLLMDVPHPRLKVWYSESTHQAMSWEGVGNSWDAWDRFLERKISLSPAFRRARVFHVLVEGGGHACARAVRDWGSSGIVSIEPVLDPKCPTEDYEGSIGVMRDRCDVVSPDWTTSVRAAARYLVAVFGTSDAEKRRLLMDAVTNDEVGEIDDDVAIAVGDTWMRALPQLRVLAIRCGPKGSYVITQGGDTWHIPVATDPVVVDPTGAGNCYAAAFAAAYAKTNDPLRAGAMATGAATCMLAQHGPPSFSPTLVATAEAVTHDVLSRSRKLHP
eukprot:Rmarinus@m.4234